MITAHVTASPAGGQRRRAIPRPTSARGWSRRPQISLRCVDPKERRDIGAVSGNRAARRQRRCLLNIRSAYPRDDNTTIGYRYRQKSRRVAASTISTRTGSRAVSRAAQRRSVRRSVRGRAARAPDERSSEGNTSCCQRYHEVDITGPDGAARNRLSPFQLTAIQPQLSSDGDSHLRSRRHRRPARRQRMRLIVAEPTGTLCSKRHAMPVDHPERTVSLARSLTVVGISIALRRRRRRQEGDAPATLSECQFAQRLASGAAPSFSRTPAHLLMHESR